MIDPIYLFLPGIIILGLITSYTDLKYGKIKNQHILFALAYSFTVYTILILNLDSYRVAYFIELIVMMVLTLFTGFIIWYVGLWTAGDAKLFLAYSALLPLSVYKYGYVPYFASTNILINTFIPIALFLFISLIFKTNLRQKTYSLKKAFQPKQLLTLAIFLFAFIWVTNLLFLVLKIPQNYFVMIFFLFLIMAFLERILHLNLIKTTIVVSALRLILDKTVYTLTSLKFFLFIFIAFVIVRFFILNLGFISFTKQVDIKLLKPGMVPAEAIYKENKKYRKQALLYFSLFSYLDEKTKKQDYIFEPTSEGLTPKDTALLKKLNLPFEHLAIHKTLSFALFMFLGALLTIIAQGNAIIAMRLLF